MSDDSLDALDEENEVGQENPDPNVLDLHKLPTTFVDWLVHAGQYEGVVSLALGSIDSTNQHPSAPGFPSVVVGAKLRMSVAFAERLGTLLVNMASNAKAPNEGPAEDDLEL